MWYFITLLVILLGSLIWAGLVILRTQALLVTALSQVKEANENGAWRLVVLAQEAMMTLKAGSIEAKVAGDVRLQHARVELEQLKQELRGQPAGPMIPSANTATQIVKGISPTGAEVEVNLDEYDIFT